MTRRPGGGDGAGHGVAEVDRQGRDPRLGEGEPPEARALTADGRCRSLAGLGHPLAPGRRGGGEVERVTRLYADEDPDLVGFQQRLGVPGEHVEELARGGRRRAGLEVGLGREAERQCGRGRHLNGCSS